MNQKIVIRRPGGLDRIEVVEEAEPVPASGEAKIRVLAAGCAYGDVLLRRGLAGGRFPVTPGYDVVGRVEALGPDTSQFRAGDLVAALPGIGGQQRCICLAESELITVPPGLPADKAVSVVLNYTTAYQLLTRAAHLKMGDVGFVYGLAGGIGTAMRQIAKHLGIVIYGTASGGKLETVRRDGTVAFERDDPNLIAAVHAQRPGGVDAVFDPIGGASLGRSYRLLAPDGTLVMLGAASAVQGDGTPKLKLAGTLARFLQLKLRPGSRHVKIFVILQSKKKHPGQFRNDVATMLDWLKDGKIDPVIDRTLPLSEARHAQELLEGSRVSGKIVLET